MSVWAKALRVIYEHIRYPYATWIHIRFILGGAQYRRIHRKIRKDFDAKFYQDAYPEIRQRGISPLQHFIVVGWREGKDPNEGFSINQYRETHRDVAQSGANPFFHYVSYGRSEGRIARPSTARRRTVGRPTRKLSTPTLATRESWQEWPARVLKEPPTGAVTVVIPVYKGLRYVSATLESVLKAKNETPFEVLAIDDATPEPPVRSLLVNLERLGKIRLLTNTENLGFVRSVNRGMAACPDRDVVLLNADTIVHNGWLDRLARPVKRDPDIASVTPLSNNATLASYPDTAVDNAFELEVPSATIDRLAAEANGDGSVDIPTAVGFCMYIRRAALRELGDFDADTFGLGYGEENDWSLRALKAGWRNVLATGVYVRHFGSMSFGPEVNDRQREARIRLNRKHPDFDGRVRRYFAADRSLLARMRLDAARLREYLGGVSVLFISHKRGGGVQTFLDNAREQLIRDGFANVVDRALVVAVEPSGWLTIAGFGNNKLPYIPNLQPMQVDRHTDCLGDIFRLLAPELIHVNSFAGLNGGTIARLMDAIRAAGRPYWHIWHDHQPLCPRLNFLDAEENYCGETNIDLCSPCLAASKSDFEWTNITEWRERFRTYLAGATMVSAPSEAAALRARRLVDVSKVKVHPHPQPLLTGFEPLQEPERRDGVLRVLIIGAIGPHKGANLLYGMIRDACVRDLPIRFDIVGFTSERRIKTGPHVIVHGRYNGDEEAARRIAKLQPDLCFASSVVPETFSFILSVAMGLRLPLVAFDMGAPSDRIPKYGRGTLLPTAIVNDPAAVNDALLALNVGALWATEPNMGMEGYSALSEHFREVARGTGLDPEPARDLIGAGAGARDLPLPVQRVRRSERLRRPAIRPLQQGMQRLFG